MKKVIFISALAIAAAVSCTKSDIVDTKFNEQISFQTYTGRAAQTKAAVTDNSNIATVGVGLYGYYLGNAQAWGEASKANLWANDALTPKADAPTVWEVAGKPKYWANDADKYAFLAYSPRTAATEGAYYVSTGTAGENPEINYTVNSDLSQQIDLLYAKAEGTAATFKTSGVALTMGHALSRLTVKAKEVADTGFDFYVKEVKISGDFYTAGVFNLYEGIWDAEEYETKEDGETYSFYNAQTNTTALTTTAEDYAYYAKNESGVYTKGTSATNYLMMIPTTEDVTLYVKYTTFYEGQESTPIEKTLTVTQDFVMGKAYAIELAFSHTQTPITFTVTVSDWVAGTENADDDKNGVINGGNPNGGTPWV